MQPSKIRKIGIAYVLISVVIGSSEAAVVREKYIRSKQGISIHIVDSGAGDSILFIPGWTMPAEIWKQQIRYFAKDHRVVAMDRRCQGRSQLTSEGHFPEACSDDIEAVIERLGLNHLVIVAWSMGVRDTLAFVQRYGSGGVSKFVFVDGYAGGDLESTTLPERLRFIHRFQTNRLLATKEFVAGMFVKPQNHRFLKELESAALKTPTSIAVASFIGMLTTDLRPTLASIDRPVLIVGCESSEKRLSEMGNRLPVSRMQILRDAGHAVFVDKSNEFNSLVQAFIQE